MSEAIGKIQEILREAKLESSLTSEAYKYFSQLQEDFTETKKMLAEKTEEHEQERALRVNLEAELQTYQRKEQQLEEMAKNLSEKEFFIVLKEQEVALKEAHAKDRVDDHKNMFSQVFRNIDIRKQVFDSVSTEKPYVDANGYPCTMPVNNTKHFDEKSTTE